MPLYKAFRWFSTSKISHFLIKFRSKFHIFFDASFRTSFFDILTRPGAKKLDFGTTLGAQLRPNGAQNHPSGANNAQNLKDATAFLRTCFQDHIRNAPGHHFGRFWDGISKMFNGIWYHDASIFYKILATILHTTKAACPDDIGHAIRGQLPVTPPGAPFSQYFWRALLSKARF